MGNILPIWDDPLWLVEQLSMIDMISKGRLVSGWVRGTGRESVSHNAPPAYNWERFQEAHDFIIKAWTTPGPFRWEGKHFQYRYVNPWVRPYQKPHPPIWLPGVVSRDSLEWAAKQRIPYIMLATELDPTKQAFQLYQDTAAEVGYDGIYNRQAANVTAQPHMGYFAPGRFRSMVITELVCRACTSISRFLCLFGS